MPTVTPGDPEAEAGDGDEEEAAFPEPGAADPENEEPEALPDTRVVEVERLPDGHEPPSHPNRERASARRTNEY